MKPTCQSAAVKTSAQAGAPARGIRSHNTSMIESAKRTHVEGRRWRSEGVPGARTREVRVTCGGASEVRVTRNRRCAVRVTVIVESPAVIEKTRATRNEWVMIEQQFMMVPIRLPVMPTPGKAAK